MATEVKIPIPDQTTEEVRIVQWKKNDGDTVKKDEIVLEVETDKSIIEVEAVGDGVLLKQLFAVDDMVPVGKVVALIGEAGETAESATGDVPAEAAKAVPTTATSTQVPISTASDDKRIKASPVAKKLADKLGIDLAQVKGTGPHGRINRQDVEQFVQKSTSSASVGATVVGGRIIASPNAKRIAKEKGVDINLVPGSGPDSRILGKDVQQYAASAPAVAAASGQAMVPAKGQPQPGSAVQMTKMRRAIGLNLQMSSRETPHFNVTMSIDMSRAMGVRKQLNESRPKEKRISVNDLVVRACALALKQYSAVNSRMEEDKIHYMADINVGVATAVADGLVVPVLTHADNRDWDDMAEETKRLANEARNGKIIGAGKGTFTVSNLGMFGVDNFTAIINPPESAILAVGAIKDEVVAIKGGIGIRPMMKVILCSDHRIIDGALAAQFLQAVKTYLEEEIG